MLTLGELRKGVECLADPARRLALLDWLETELPAFFAGRVLAVDATARKLAVLIWHMLTKQQDYVWVRPALLQFKIRRLELMGWWHVATRWDCDGNQTDERADKAVSAHDSPSVIELASAAAGVHRRHHRGGSRANYHTSDNDNGSSAIGGWGFDDSWFLRDSDRRASR